MDIETNDSARIALLNDILRETGVGGMALATIGIRALPSDVQTAILAGVRNFSAFTEDNDPHGEHDFGSFQINGLTVNWKIDYYDRAMELHSPDAANSAVTTRVLTIMLAEEY